MQMIDLSGRITRVTTSSDPISRKLANGARAPTGARVTLEFTRTAPLSAGQEVRLRYDIVGNGHFRDCIGIPQPTHSVARRGHLVVFHYRLSHWIASTARLPERFDEAPAAGQSPA